MRHTLADPAFLAANPEARARDLMDAFADSTISGIVTTIGGDDSIRLIPYLDLDVIARNPKAFLGFSDSTTLHFACFAAGLVSFYGPSIMAGFAENGGMHRYTIDGVRRALFQNEPIGLIAPNAEGWTAERLEWGDPTLQTRKRQMQRASAPRILQGSGIARGHLLGGCAEVMEMVKGSAWWPAPDAWHGAILFFETSEEAPAPELVKRWLRNFAAQGILESLSGMVLARPDARDDVTYQAHLEAAVVDAFAEARLSDIAVLSGLDFGHTQPMLTLPYGVHATIDCSALTMTIDESGVS